MQLLTIGSFTSISELCSLPRGLAVGFLKANRRLNDDLKPFVKRLRLLAFYMLAEKGFSLPRQARPERE